MAEAGTDEGTDEKSRQSVRPAGYRTFRDMLEVLEVIALGELNLTPEQFGKYTVSEIDAMFDGYLRRYDALEDLMIINCALPIYRGCLLYTSPSPRD